MQKKSIIFTLLLLTLGLTFSACSEDATDPEGTEEGEHMVEGLELDGKSLFFYSSATNDHLAYDVDESTLVNLNNNSEDGYFNYNMNPTDNGKFLLWLDNKGDDNLSNDEQKILMLNQAYSYANDGNATYEDFYYLGHFHTELEEDGDTHYHLAAHANEEFDLSNVPAQDLATNPKYQALKRLNVYLAEQNLIKNNIQTTLDNLQTPATLCGFESITNDLGTRNYAMGTDGQLYVFDNSLSGENTYGYIDQVTLTASCEVNKVGITAVSEHDENGVVIFQASTQKLYLVDSHEGGIYHAHRTWDASEIIGSASAEMMSAIIPVGYESSEEHEDHDH